MLHLALELNSSHFRGLLNHSCSTGAMKTGRRDLVLEGNLCSLLCASPVERGCFNPLGERGIKTLQLYIEGAHYMWGLLHLS